jgi:hypothetical protein
MDREQGAPRPDSHPPDPSDFRAFAPLPHVAPERPSAISNSARDELRLSASCFGARSPSAAAIRTTKPSALCQYAPSGPARTNSKSRNPYGLAKFPFARFISFASRLLSCVFAPGKEKPGTVLFRLPGFFALEKVIRLRIFSLGKGPALATIARRLCGVALLRRAPTQCEHQSASCYVRHAVSPPFVTPRARGMRTTKGDRLVTEGGRFQKGCNRNRPSELSAVSPGGMSSGRVRLLRRGHAGLRRRQ